MSEERASFYPPRARWYARTFYLGYDLRRVLQLDRIRMPCGIGLWALILSFVLPGYALTAVGLRTWGRAIGIGYALATLVFLATLGHAPANVAYGLMIAAHATSIASLLVRWMESSTVQSRVLACAGSLLVLVLLVYMPATAWLQSRLLVPLRVGDDVFVVRRGGGLGAVKRGDWIAYAIREGEAGSRGIRLAGGLGIGPVLGVAGDRVRFTPVACEVNGQPHPRQPFMPDKGDLIVPEKVWFIWPKMDIRNINVNTAQITQVLQQVAMVREERFVGRPFQHWFGRRQVTP